PAGTDRRHIASFYYAYDFPKFGKKLTHSKVVGAITDGWNLSGITGIVSGAPFTPGVRPTNSVGFTGNPTNRGRIDVVGDPYKDVPAGSPGLPHGVRYFNPAAFSVPAIGSLGNAGVNIMYGPGYINHDVTLARRIAIGERREFQLKLEA